MRVAIACRERSDLSFMYLVARPNLYGTQNHPWFWSYNPDLGTLFDKVTLDEFFHNLRLDSVPKRGLDYIKLVLYPGPRWRVKFVTEEEVRDAAGKKEVEPEDNGPADEATPDRLVTW